MCGSPLRIEDKTLRIRDGKIIADKEKMRDETLEKINENSK